MGYVVLIGAKANSSKTFALDDMQASRNYVCSYLFSEESQIFENIYACSYQATKLRRFKSNDKRKNFDIDDYNVLLDYNDVEFDLSIAIGLKYSHKNGKLSITYGKTNFSMENISVEEFYISLGGDYVLLKLRKKNTVTYVKLEKNDCFAEIDKLRFEDLHGKNCSN